MTLNWFRTFWCHWRKPTVIIIGNLTVPQRIALEDMLATWVRLGRIGASRWTAFFADGDGDFRPSVLINGHFAQKTNLLSHSDRWNSPTEGEYRIDFDTVAWRLRNRDVI